MANPPSCAADDTAARIERDVSLATQCRFEVGGPADYFAAVRDSVELRTALRFAREHGLRHFVYSGGSNLFFDDAGFRGLVIRVQGGDWHVAERELPPSEYVNRERSSPRARVGPPLLAAKAIGLRVHHGRLPHWRLEGSVYFVTWRLLDDRQRLSAPEREIVANALRHFDGEQYRLWGYVVMDDHAHTVVGPLEGARLERIVGAWKGVSARRINLVRGNIGHLWQHEYFDRILRDEDELLEKLNYMNNNPFKRWPDTAEYPWLYCALLPAPLAAKSGGPTVVPSGPTPIVTVGSGYDLPTLVRELAHRNLGGIEFLGNIPGSIGGAVVGNAGCYGRAIAEVFVEAEVFDVAEDRVFTADAELCEFAYRHSRFKDDARWVVMGCTLRLTPRPAAEITAEVEGELDDRLRKHPHFAPCAGSFFKNPPGYPAWRVITDAGLDHAAVGGARLHEKHANFLVNAGRATSADIRALVRLVQGGVREKLGLELEPEVRYVGPEGISDI